MADEAFAGASLLDLMGSILGVAVPLLGAHLWAFTLLMDKRIAKRIEEHSKVPHPVMLEKIQQIARDEAAQIGEVRNSIHADLRSVEVNQASFGSDLVWVKKELGQLQASHRDINGKLDRLIELHSAG